MKVCSACRRCYEDDILSCFEDNHDVLSDARAGGTEIIPNYRLEVLRETDKGDEAYRAVNTILNKPYLIRIIAPAAFDEAAKKRFLTEAQALAAIIHPNVARVFESGTLADGSLYVVTEYSEAQTLRECFENVGKPSEVTTLTILRQAAEGLEGLHAAGVRHRNLKPENVILTSDAENKFLIKLQNMDFGALRQRQVNAAGDLFLDDLRYFSPEQCAAEDAGEQSDVYALGVVLYESLAGKVPFDAAYADALIIKQTSEQPPEIKISSFDIRMLLTHTLTDALQKTTRARLKTANAMARRLRHIEQLATHSSTPPPVMAYPAAMNKTAVAFTPPAKSEKSVEVEKLAEVETPLETAAALETATIAEYLAPAETAAVAEAAASFETAPANENLPLTAPSIFVGDLPATAPSIIVEAATAPAVPVEDLPSIETQAVAETQPAVEIPSMETQPVVEAPDFAEETAAVEAPGALIEAPAVFEATPAFEAAPAVEAAAVAEEIAPAVDNAAVIEYFAEPEAVAEIAVPAESEAAVEMLSSAESEMNVEDAFAPETVVENSDADEIRAGVVDAPEIQAAGEESARVAEDYSTTKLPPIEKILSDPNFKITEIETVFSLKRGKSDIDNENLDIHKTSEPVLIKWEQPDDVPTTTAALNVSKKQFADVQFIPNADVTDAKVAVEDEVETDEVETDEVEYVSEAHKTRRDYASVSSVFASYEDSAGRSWNLPGKRALLTGAAVCGLMILAVGGVYLNRQMQSADTQTTAKSSPANEKTLPKPVQQQKAETSAPVQPETLITTAPAIAEPDLPNYEPREATDVKPTVSQTSSSSSKKRVADKSTENPKTDAQSSKTETAVVFDKRGNIKPSPEKKNAATKQSSSPTKTDVFTRPRVVKNPKY